MTTNMTPLSRHTLILLSAFSMLMLAGCSDANKNLPTANSGTRTIHPLGWTDTLSTSFHGVAVKNLGWQMSLCQSCHGGDYKGGTSNTSCVKCHTKSNGPENCTTCHGFVNAAPPKDLSHNWSRTLRGVGAHQLHVAGGSIGPAIACQECHVVPKSVYDKGHIDTVATNPADVRFDTTATHYLAAAKYSKESLSCANTFCHGNFSNGNVKTMVWTDVSGTGARCGTCHGDINGATAKERALPKTIAQGGTHPNMDPATKLVQGLECQRCHSGVIDGTLTADGNFKIINTSNHIR